MDRSAPLNSFFLPATVACSRCNQHQIVAFISLLGLNQCHQLGLVLAWERGSIQNRRYGLHDNGHVLGVHLRKRCRISHFL